jgi:high-affinity iron transporter
LFRGAIIKTSIRGETERDNQANDRATVSAYRRGRAPRTPRSDGDTEAAWWRRRGSFSRRIVVLVVGCAVLAGVGSGIAMSHGGAAVGDVVVTDNSCASGWVPPRSGETVFTVKNESADNIFEVELVDQRGSVYGEIDMLAPGTSDTMDATLPPQRYFWECDSFDGAQLTGPVQQVDGPPVIGAHPYQPVSSDDIDNAWLVYRLSLQPVMKRLEIDTDRLESAVETGDLAQARKLWLRAHLDYARLGAAYDTFGPYNALIDGRPLGLVGGVRSRQFHGFLRLEYGLWHDQSVPELVPVAHQLDSAVHSLAKSFPHMIAPANDLSLRTHEILENTLQFELSGETDEGSNTNIATAWANVGGTELSLDAIAPLLHALQPALLSRLRAGVAGLATSFLGYRHPDGTWTPLQALTTIQRERLDGETSALLEQLDAVPDLLELPIQPVNGND